MRFSVGFLMEGKESRDGEPKLFANFQGAICLNPADEAAVKKIAKALRATWSCEHWEANGHYMAGAFAGVIISSANIAVDIMKRGNGFILETSHRELFFDADKALSQAIKFILSVEEALDKEGLYKRD